MPFITQEHKKRIAEILKSVVPHDWKYGLRIHDHRTIIMTIKSAPIDLIEEAGRHCVRDGDGEYWTDFYAYRPEIVRRLFKDEKLGEIFGKIVEALNLDNHDNSDAQSDYFDVGHCVDLRLGYWGSPFLVVQDGNAGLPARPAFGSCVNPL